MSRRTVRDWLMFALLAAGVTVASVVVFVATFAVVLAGVWLSNP